MTKNMKMFFDVLAVVIIVVGLIYLIGSSPGDEKETSSTTNQDNIELSSENVQVTEEPKVIEEIKVSEGVLAKHNKESDCWVAYKGEVYDVTEFLPKHPGSAKAISPYCGTAKEFEEAFLKKHGTTKAAFLMKVATFIGDFEVKGNLLEAA